MATWQCQPDARGLSIFVRGISCATSHGTGSAAPEKGAREAKRNKQAAGDKLFYLASM